MCGICGVIGENIKQQKATELLNTIAYRGPDDEGYYCEEKIFLGHRRLAILDTTKLGHQPMQYKDYIIVFNGEIYNYIELREELKKIGHEFNTETDTEVILHAYAEWKEDIFEKLRGMWGLAIYDKKEQTVILSRDRFGIKPLYYYFDQSVLIFSSDIRTILKYGISPKANTKVILKYLAVGIDNNGKDTFFKNIRQVPASYNIKYKIKNKDLLLYKYYDLNKVSKKTINRLEYEKELILTIKQHLRSDVKIGTCLSGGLDSSTLTSIVQKELVSSNLLSFTAKSEDINNDEVDFAKIVAKENKLDWKIVYPQFIDFKKYHLEMLKNQVEPVGSPSIFMQFWVMKFAKENGVKVLLDGQGGDETLLGYERYYISYLIEFLKNGNLREFLKNYFLISRNSKLNIFSLFKYLVYFSIDFFRKIILYKRLSFIKKDYLIELFENDNDYLKQKIDLRSLQVSELMENQLPHLLRYEDRNSMYFGIEARVPFVDHVLVEKALNLDVKDKIFGGYTKYCLRIIAEKYLPKSIAWRKNKAGFEAPEKIWLTDFCAEMQNCVNDSKIIKSLTKKVPNLKNLNFRLRWRLYNIAVFEKQYLSNKNKYI